MTAPENNPAAPGDQGTPPPAPAPTPPAGAPADAWDSSTGKGGKDAVLADLKATRDELKALKERQASLEPLAKLAAALGGGDTDKGKTEIEQITARLATQEKDLADERAARWRAEIATEKKLSLAQASRLQGSTREELLADADQLLTLFPVAPTTPGLQPDRSQGTKGGGSTPSLDEQIADAQAKKDWKALMQLNALKLAEVAGKTT